MGERCLKDKGRLFSVIKLSIIIFLLFGFPLGCGWLPIKPVRSTKSLPPLHQLSSATFQETWYEIIFNGRKIGFFHLKPAMSERNPDLFQITYDLFYVINFMGVKNAVILKEIDRVNPDLTLLNFENDITINERRFLIDGTVRQGNLLTKINDGHCIINETVRLNELLYPFFAGVVNLYLSVNGAEVGKIYEFMVYDPFSRSLQKVRQRVLSYGKSEFFDETAFQVKTKLASLGSISWINDKGETVFGTARGGRLLIAREEEAAARQFIYQKSFSKADDFLEFCRVETDHEILCCRGINSLEIKLEGLRDKGLIISDQRQQVVIKEEGDRWAAYFKIEVARVKERGGHLSSVQAEKFNDCLTPSILIQSRHPEIISQAESILCNQTELVGSVKKLVAWVNREVKDDPVDSISVLKVLRTKKGGCRARTYLYTALSRAAGIPTRPAWGLVYREGTGFLYHSWAESFVGHWIAVDPSYGQVPADASHIKLAEGEVFNNLSPLIDVIGHLRAKVINYQ